ncbi:MAG TPA: DUF5615 family PIN-like protein [Candidatus Binatia bacterium]|nr:DUF5615 family PIN-like protein [Candidatus Binatia bacterium]
MNFLIDTCLPATLVDYLRRAGYDAVHVRRYGIHKAEDEIVFDRAVEEARVLVSADTTFATSLAVRHTPNPSVIIFCQPFALRSEKLVKLLLDNLPNITEPLNQGGIVFFEKNRLRIRSFRPPKVEKR